MNKKWGVISLIIASFLVFLIYLFLCVDNFVYPLKYQTEIKNASITYNIKSSVIASVINAESGFDKNAVSSKGAVGLMQIMPATARFLAEQMNVDYNEDMLAKEQYNINMGTYYLRYLFDKFDELKLVLCAYNAGEGTLVSWLKDKSLVNENGELIKIPYTETAKYVSKVEKSLSVYEKKLG